MAQVPERGWLWQYRALIGLTVLCALAAIGGYWDLFNTFQFYDDEGYFLVVVRNFLDGAVLYDTISTCYGPAYFLFKGVVHGLLGLPLTNDAVRFLTLGIWLLLALGCACAVGTHRRRLTATGLTFLLVFRHLIDCTNEPSHPQEFAAGLLILAVLAPACFRRRSAAWTAAALGALAGTMLLVKVNIGLFGLVTLAGIGATAAAPSRWRGLLRGAVALGCLALPWVLLRASLMGPEAGPYIAYASIVSLALLGSLVVGYGSSDFSSLRLAWGAATAAALGWLGAIAIVIGAVLTTGTTLTSLCQCIFLTPLQFMPAFAAFGWEPPVTTFAAGCAAIAAAMAVLMCVLHHRRQPRRSAWLGILLKIGYGAAMVGWVTMGRPTVFQFAAPWAWLLWVPRPSPTLSDRDRIGRLVLPWFALPQLLLPYPVPGSQIAFGTFLLIPVSVWCLWDGLEDLRGFLPRPVQAHWAGLYALFALLAMAATAGPLAKHVRAARWQYLASEPLGLPGAHLVRVEPKMADAYRTMAGLLREHADTFLCSIGLNSMYHWTGLKPPCAIVISHAVTMRTNAEQQLLIASLLAHTRPILVYHESLFERGSPDAPFFQLVRANFREWRVVDEGYQLMVPIAPESAIGHASETYTTGGR
ncbi:MAG: hypothetical protein K8T26_03390 [Lentisphaerae bacterium]|nr:hypothetical protein [Lentisphaerota bacterium]